MTIDEQLAWYDALKELEWRLASDVLDPWFERVQELRSELWWSSGAFRVARMLQSLTHAD